MNKFTLVAALALFSGQAAAQKKSKSPDGLWYQKNSTKKSITIDLDKAYAELLKDRKASEIVVAVIDGGTDINHPDLKANLWHNPGEIPFNNIDDDNNGYVDDTVGWNFIGGPGGANVHYDNLEMTRLVRLYSAEFEELEAEDIDNPERRGQYELYQTLKMKVKENYESNKETAEKLRPVLDASRNMKKRIGKDNPSAEDIEKYNAQEQTEMVTKIIYMATAKKSKMSFNDFIKELTEATEQMEAFYKYHYNVDFDPRNIVGDQYENASQRHYGNNDVAGPDAFHGTHVAGIIAAVRGNGIGVEGVASSARIMVVRVVPDGDERDKDVANGIRYAVDNGAKIINMSFGKSYKFNKPVVDSAIAYAVSKGVLLVHAAGNDGENNDVSPNYPNDSMPDGSFAETWMEIGASQAEPKHVATSFSNYGKANVDLFAPGYQINSTAPGNTYEKANGTSMAAPVTSGVAALIWSHYPTLTAKQVKEILMKSSTPVKKPVVLPGTEKDKVAFSELSVSGGVLNAYKALQFAAQIAGK